MQSSVYRVFFLPEDLASYRQTIRRFQRLAANPFFEIIEEVKEVNQAFGAHRGGIMTRMFMPGVLRLISLTADAEANQRLSQLALIVSAYKLRTGRFPDTLAQVLSDHFPRIPIDPFDGKSLRMKRDGNDLLLYSVGYDREDNDGVPWDPNRQRGDLVFRLRGR